MTKADVLAGVLFVVIVGALVFFGLRTLAKVGGGGQGQDWRISAGK